VTPTPSPADLALTALSSASLRASATRAGPAQRANINAPNVRKSPFQILIDRASSPISQTSQSNEARAGSARSAKFQGGSLSARAFDVKAQLTRPADSRQTTDPGNSEASGKLKEPSDDSAADGTSNASASSRRTTTAPSDPNAPNAQSNATNLSAQQVAQALAAAPSGTAVKSSQQGVAQQAKADRGLTGDARATARSADAAQDQAAPRADIASSSAAADPIAPSSPADLSPEAIDPDNPEHDQDPASDDSDSRAFAADKRAADIVARGTATPMPLSDPALTGIITSTSLAASISSLLLPDRAGRLDAPGHSSRQDIWSLAPTTGPIAASGNKQNKPNSGNADGSPAGSARTPPPIDAQLAEGLSATLRHIPSPAGQRVVTIRLDPAELGRVRVQMRVAGEVVSIKFQVGTAAARSAVERSQADLKASIERRGLRVDSFSVETTDDLAPAPVAPAQAGLALTGSNGAPAGPDAPGKPLALIPSDVAQTVGHVRSSPERDAGLDEGGVLEHLTLRVDARA